MSKVPLPHTGRVADDNESSSGPRSSESDQPVPATRAKRTQRIAVPGGQLIGEIGGYVQPVQRRVTSGEHRWPVTLAMATAIALQFALPTRLVFGPRWFLPALQAAVVLGLVISSPVRIERISVPIRVASLTLVAIVSFGNAFSAFRLVRGLISGTEGESAGSLLLTGAAIWLTNVLVFAFWYWDLDGGGPAQRAIGAGGYPAFLFAQMQSPEVAPDDWKPTFVDYLYLSFTNATAFSPTDVLPLARWAKLTMMLQSLVSLSTVALVIARAVNILK